MGETEEGTEMEGSAEHSAKSPSGNEARLDSDSKTTEDKALQEEKQPEPRDVREEGRMIDCRDEQE
jgi:hypothetical protein